MFKPIVFLLATVAVVPCRSQPPQNPAEAFENMFKAFGENAGPMVPLFGKLSPEQLRRLEAVEVSIAEEKLFGQQILEAYLERLAASQISTLSRGADVEYLQQLCQIVQPSMKRAARYRQLDLRIVDTDIADAYSVPGGHLLFTRGLLDSCGSEAALVGTLAHELSHLDRGHQLIPLKQSKLAQQPLDFEDSMMWLSLVARPFRPEQESEADLDATRWMMAAGYDPRELSRLLNSWEQQQSRTMPWMQFVPGFVKSHPNPGLRAQEILQQRSRLRRRFPDASYIGVENLRQRLPKSKREFR